MTATRSQEGRKIVDEFKVQCTVVVDRNQSKREMYVCKYVRMLGDAVKAEWTQWRVVVDGLKCGGCGGRIDKKLTT